MLGSVGNVVKCSQVLRCSLWLMIVRTDIVGRDTIRIYSLLPPLPHEKTDIYIFIFIFYHIHILLVAVMKMWTYILRHLTFIFFLVFVFVIVIVSLSLHLSLSSRVKHFAGIVDAVQEEGRGEGSETICKIILSASPQRNSSHCKNEYIVSDARERKYIFFSKNPKKKRKGWPKSQSFCKNSWKLTLKKNHPFRLSTEEFFPLQKWIYGYNYMHICCF